MVYFSIQNVSLRKLIISVIATILIILVLAIGFTTTFIADNNSSINKTFLGYKDDYTKQIASNVREYRKVMGILGVKNGIKEEIFKKDVTQSEMVLVSKKLRRIINETLTYYFENTISYDYYVYSYLPSDGNMFKNLQGVNPMKFKDGYSYSHSDVSNTDYISFYGQINNFILNSYSAFVEIGDGVCYQELKIATTNLFKVRFTGKNGNLANIYLYDKKTSKLIYSSDLNFIDTANNIYYDVKTQDITNTDILTKNKTTYSIGSLDVVDASVIYLYNTPFSYSLKSNSDFTASLIVFIASSLTCILIVLCAYYLSFASNIVKLTRKMDKYGDETQKYVQTFKGNNEVALIDKHLVLMHAKIVELIKEVYLNKTESLNAHNQALIASINPHFLYNTLNSICSMATIENADETAKMVECLSNMFRYITTNQTSKVLLKEELEQINQYIYIQQIRYDGEFTFDVDIPNESLSYYIPKFILQPLVENFFKHGFNIRNKMFSLEISAKIIDDNLFIYIYDTGKGINEQRLSEVRQTLLTIDKDIKESVGVQNVNKRIKFMYGDEYGLDIESVYTEYTRVTIKLPIEMEGA